MGGIISSGKKYSSEGEEKKDQEELVNGIHTRIGYSSLFSTVSSHLLDPQELFEKQKLQEKLADFVIQHFFYGVPVSSKKKSTVTGLGPIWIEPLPHIVEQSLAGQFEEGHDPLATAPTGVLVNGDCSIKIYFTLSSVEYTIPSEVMLSVPTLMKNPALPPMPSPPVVEAASENNLFLTWKTALPYPVGLVDIVEVQYRSIVLQEGETMEEINEKSFIEEDEGSSPTRRKWSSLVTRQYHRSSFYEFMFDHLPAGRYYQFRLRYHCFKGWSEYSIPSPVAQTLACAPAQPPPPICTTITSNAVELKWLTPINDNGSPIEEYLLYGKSVGDEYIELYRGLNRSFLAIGLYPEFGYSFKLAARNAIGISDFSHPVSVQTPMNSAIRALRRYQRRLATHPDPSHTHSTPHHHPHHSQTLTEIVLPNEDENSMEFLLGKTELLGYTEQQILLAIHCRHAWQEFWDPKIEKYFYFNTILGFRQLTKPTILRNPPPEEEGEAANTTTDHQIIPENPIERLLHPPKKDKTGKTLHSHHHSSHQAMDPLEKLENSMEFRQKRYQFLRALSKHRLSMIDSITKSRLHGIPQPPNGPRSSFGSSSEHRPSTSSSTRDSTKLELQRETILLNFYQFLQPWIPNHHLSSFSHSQSTSGTPVMNPQGLIALFKRFKVHFIGEDGIDSGGLSKETFLLLSKELVKYLKYDSRHWMNYTKGYKPPVRINRRYSKYLDNNEASSDEEKEDSKESEQRKKDHEESYIDGLFFFEEEDHDKHSSPASHHQQHHHGKKDTSTPSYLEQSFLSPADYGAVLGITLGKALLDGHLIDFPLSSTLIKYLLGDIQSYFMDPTLIMSTTTTHTNTSKVSTQKLVSSIQGLLTELKHLDVELYNSLDWMLKNDITNIIEETFSIQKVRKGMSASTTSTSINSTSNNSTPITIKPSTKKQFETIALCPNGEHLNVTEMNKQQYIYLRLLYYFHYSIEEFITPFVYYFHQLIPITILREYHLHSSELYLLLNGKKTINIEELRAYCLYESITNQQLLSNSNISNQRILLGGGPKETEEDIVIWNETHRMIQWLWRILRESSSENKKLFLQFFTGTTCLPLDGFNPPITIVYGIDMIPNSLPKAHICFHQLVLPEYHSYEKMKEQILFAIHNTNSFEFS